MGGLFEEVDVYVYVYSSGVKNNSGSWTSPYQRQSLTRLMAFCKLHVLASFAAANKSTGSVVDTGDDELEVTYLPTQPTTELSMATNLFLH